MASPGDFYDNRGHLRARVRGAGSCISVKSGVLSSCSLQRTRTVPDANARTFSQCEGSFIGTAWNYRDEISKGILRTQDAASPLALMESDIGGHCIPEKTPYFLTTVRTTKIRRHWKTAAEATSSLLLEPLRTAQHSWPTSPSSSSLLLDPCTSGAGEVLAAVLCKRHQSGIVSYAHT